MIRRMIMGMRIRRFSCSPISRTFKGSVIAPFLMSRLYCCVIYARIYLDIYALIYIIKLFMRQIYALILRRQHGSTYTSKSAPNQVCACHDWECVVGGCP